jgi:nitrite reductase (NADH) large subunit
MTSTRRLIVIGNGMAGARFVEEIVTRGGPDRFAVTVFGDEPVGNYNRILLSSVLAGSHQPRDIFINPLPWYAEHGVILHAGSRVTAIDLEHKQVSAGSRLVEPYDVLVMATGSRGFVPPMDGARTEIGTFKEGLFVFRTLDDCDRILARGATSRTAVVIGGGLLGLEAARGLLNR